VYNKFFQYSGVVSNMGNVTIAKTIANNESKHFTDSICQSSENTIPDYYSLMRNATNLKEWPGPK